MARKNLPGYLLHKASGQAIVVINGKTTYLGRYKSKASREEYERVIADYLANGRKSPPQAKTGISVEELGIRFLDWCESYYLKNGKMTETVEHCQRAVSLLVKHFGKESVNPCWYYS